ncbi:hypothetical protein RFM41_12125 [Mesorhizobium sp. VK25A]|uniref:Uncharacterized protein n=1 Tax=Mesorhizobium vachelliae TaxID=3072309 RepID=A0ABU4ZXG0_9HYPH|nr:MULTISPECIES: hypothetical protein [unclassified Mesorhizobium]MDX8530090.1 hypothetical protein [Mesorhizobium sp. VK25D]MDX8544488.1 hypothetical protein [Mesorhizobium sp. VK25A]
MNDNNHAGTTTANRAVDDADAIATGIGVSVARDSPIAALLETAGHSRDCIMRVRSGWVEACSCEGHARPFGDASMAIGLAIRFARMGAAHSVPIPPGVLALLVEQVDAGNPAAVLVWRWLAGRGQVPTPALMRPKLRLVKGEAR